MEITLFIIGTILSFALVFFITAALYVLYALFYVAVKVEGIHLPNPIQMFSFKDSEEVGVYEIGDDGSVSRVTDEEEPSGW